MPAPKYSLLLPVRNEAGRIDGVVRAIFADLAGRPDWEVRIADDCSDDGTYERLQALTAEFPFSLLRPPANLGRGAIRNLLAQEAAAPMLAFLDGDCRVQPGFFQAWEDLDPDTAYLGQVCYDREPKSGFSRFLSRGSGIGKLASKENIPPAYFISQNFRVSKSIFTRVKGFRTDLKGWGGEDLDLGCKLVNLGTPITYNAKAVVYHPSVTGLDAYFGRLIDFGKTNLPVLIADNPGLADQFKLKFSRWPWSALFCNPGIFFCCRSLIVGLKGWPWPFVLYRYAIFYAYARGYRQREISARR